MLNQSPQLVDGKLPVFVFPTSLIFYSDDQATHKQVLTLYNPYDFPLRFKVLSTAPRKYTVVDSEGTIRPRCCVDIVLRHLDICVNNEGTKDQFRIQITEFGYKKVLGKKDVSAVLLPRKEQISQPEDDFQSLPFSSQGSSAATDIPLSLSTGHRDTSRASAGPSLIIVVAAVCCIIALIMPQQGEATSRLPEYLHLSVHQKLIAAYILDFTNLVNSLAPEAFSHLADYLPVAGLVTMVILQL